MERSAAPSLLPILRSRQQGELLALLLGDPELEASLTDLAALVSVPVSSVHREIDRAEPAGLVTSRKIGNTRLVRANTDSPYYRGLADVLVKAFGPPRVLAAALAPIDNIDTAHIYGSWAAHLLGNEADRPVGDIDLLVLGSPDRDELYRGLRCRTSPGTTRASHRPARRLAQHGHRQLPRHCHPTPAGGDRPQVGSNRDKPPLSLIRRAPTAADCAVEIAHAASSWVIVRPSGSKYWALWRIRRKFSKIGFANALITLANWAETASSIVTCDPSPPVERSP